MKICLKAKNDFKIIRLCNYGISESYNYSIIVNLKNQPFYKDKILFFNYVMLAQEVIIGDKQVEAGKN